MIAVRVQGGLGNQMFIYAAGRAWALKNSTELALDTINGGYGEAEAFGRSYKLGNFEIRASIAVPDKVRRYNPSSRSFYWLRKINSFLPLRFRTLVLEPRQFNPRLPCARLRADAYLAGYWQREDYFLPYADIIRRELRSAHPPKPEVQVLAKAMQQGSSVFIHFRRKQYGFKLLPLYYLDAISLITSRVQNPQFFVFGDDIAWARRTLKLPADTRYFEDSGDRTDADDLWLMSQCRHAVIANSSFSWWGAWLRQDPDTGIVIAPLRWGYAGKAASGWQTVPCELEEDRQYI
jgi:hypothetical protein